MQQVFMLFVPAVFKKSLDQYFTPIGLVKAMVEMVKIGPNDKIADPGMGTADFLTAAVEVRANAGDTDSLRRICGWDSDAKASHSASRASRPVYPSYATTISGMNGIIMTRRMSGKGPLDYSSGNNLV
jgi:N-6 DNA Methylase